MIFNKVTELNLDHNLVLEYFYHLQRDLCHLGIHLLTLSFYYYFNVYLFQERLSKCAHARMWERGRESENPKQAPCCQHRD